MGMSEAKSTISYAQLQDHDSIRLLEVIGYDIPTTQLQGRLLTTRLRDRPNYHALSYVWGSTASAKSIQLEHNGVAIIRENLFNGLKELARTAKGTRFWADQVCINQRDEREKEQQVKLMSRIFCQAKQVVGWLGTSTPETDLAIKTFRLLGLYHIERCSRSSRRFRRGLSDLKTTGCLDGIEDIFDPSKPIWKACTCLVQMAWFQRLWIVQEVALASTLELRCGGATISGTYFFAAVEVLCLTATAPPNPSFLEPFRNAFKLGQLRQQVSSGAIQSYPHLAQVLSCWDCEKSQDRLNALYGVVFRNSSSPEVWFTPSYDLSTPKLYESFALTHIEATKSIEILHFAGHIDGNTLGLLETGDGYFIQLNRPANDIPSWVPDWRIQTRLLVLLQSHKGALSFSATSTGPVYSLDRSGPSLRVRARVVDQIVACGIPYCDKVNRRFGISDHQIFNNWYDLARNTLVSEDINSMFASTLLLEGRIQGIEHQQIVIETASIIEYFNAWALRNIDQSKSAKHKDQDIQIDDGTVKSTHFGYQAEEICRNRSFFITKGGLMGLGSLAVSPSASIVLIHGLKTPFVVQKRQDRDSCHGECYVNGLMDKGIEISDDDVYLNLT